MATPPATLLSRGRKGSKDTSVLPVEQKLPHREWPSVAKAVHTQPIECRLGKLPVDPPEAGRLKRQALRRGISLLG
jgi:hypothetical protein